MSEMLLTELACPNCAAPVRLRPGRGQQACCDACGSEFVLKGHLCRKCGQYHDELRRYCIACGEKLTRICQRCQIDNPADDEFCRECGGAMDLLDAGALEHRRQTREHRQSFETKSRELRAATDETLNAFRCEFEKADADRQSLLTSLTEQAQARIVQSVRMAIVTVVVLSLGLVGIAIALATSSTGQ